MFTTRPDCALRHGRGADSPERPLVISKEKHPLEDVMSQLRAFAAHQGKRVPFASISTALDHGGGPAAHSMKEAKTGAEFPETYCHLSRKDCPTLMGVG